MKHNNEFVYNYPVETKTSFILVFLFSSTVVIMAGIIGGAVVLSVIAIVTGVVYVNKYRFVLCLLKGIYSGCYLKTG